MKGFGLHKKGHHSPYEFTSFTFVAQCEMRRYTRAGWCVSIEHVLLFSI